MRQTLAEEITEQLLEKIRREGYRPGDKLPTEAELSRELGVGRNTLREALRMLASRNVLEIRHGSGCFISEKRGISDDPLGFVLVRNRKRLTLELLEVRLMLEPEIAAMAAQNRTEQDLEELQALLESIEGLIREKKDYSEADSAFHSRIADCTHNSVLSSFIPVITRGVMLFAETVDRVEYEQTLNSHRAIYEAIAQGRSVDAEREMRYHLLYNEKRYRGYRDADER